MDAYDTQIFASIERYFVNSLPLFFHNLSRVMRDFDYTGNEKQWRNKLSIVASVLLDLLADLSRPSHMSLIDLYEYINECT